MNDRWLRMFVRETIERSSERFRPSLKHNEQGRVTPGMRFYHASPKRFRHGDVLSGGHDGGCGTSHNNVCMTTSPDPHATIRSGIAGWQGHYDPLGPDEVDPFRPGNPTRNKDWFVYEVEPIGNVTYVEGNREYQARTARVLRNLGWASALLKKRAPTAGTQAALSADRDRDRARKYAARQKRRLMRHDDDSS